MRQLVDADERASDELEDLDVERLRRVARGRRSVDGIPVEEVDDRVDNTIDVDDEAAVCSRLTEAAAADRDLLDVPEMESFRFASQFSEDHGPGH
jgi:hypothetical protein